MKPSYWATALLLAFLVGFLAPVQRVQGQVEHPITVSTILNNGTPLTLDGLVFPWGTNGVYNAIQGDTVIFIFYETARYHLMDVEIDSTSQGPISTYTFHNVTEPHTIVVTYGECAPVTNLTVSQVAGTSALVSWEDGSVGATMNYTLQYRDTTVGNWVSVHNITGTSLLLSGLTPLTDYEVRVKSFCGGNLEGDWVSAQFHTPCLVGGDIPIGNGNNLYYNFPSSSYYKYSLSEQIFTAAELGGPSAFHSISFQASNANDSNRVWDIYLMPTTRSTLTSFIDVDTTAKLVFSDTVNITSGWFTINFDSSYVYDGISNLMLIVDDNTGSFVYSNSYFCSDNPNGTSIQIFHDLTDFDPYNASSYYGFTQSVRNNIIFGSLCDTTTTCVIPNFTITSSTESTLEITWVPGYSETSWNLEYKPVADTIWNAQHGLSGSGYTITGLDANTEYLIRLQASCNSEWRFLKGRTACGEIFLPYSEDFENGIITTSQNSFLQCWDRLSSDPSHYVYRSTQHNHTAGGVGALDFHNTPNCYTMAITPTIHNNFPMSSLMIEFEAKHTGSTGTFEVGIISDSHDVNTFNVVDTIVFSSANTWEHFIVSFDHYYGLGRNIAFRASGSFGNDFVMDDLIISEIPVCVHPNNLVCTGIGSDHITLDWTEMGDATSWIVEYGPSGFIPGVGNGTTEITIMHPYTIQSLTNGVSYDFYVRSDCGMSTSDLIGPISVTAGQFNMAVTGSDTLTTCSAIIYDDGGPNGNYSANCSSTLVLFPEVSGTALMLNGTSTTQSNVDFLDIYDGVGTGGALLGSFASNTPQDIHVYSITGPLTIHFTSNIGIQRSGFELAVSCITCVAPVNIAASNITVNSADISWHGNSSSYLVTVIGSDSSTFLVHDTITTLLNLTNSRHYRVFIRSICGSDTSFASPDYFFSTLCNAITITASTPWTEDFENYPSSGNQPFLCWDTPVTSTTGNDTAPFVHCNYLRACHSGKNSAELMGYNNLLVLPEFTNNVHDLRLSFWGTSNAPTGGTLEVGVITDVTNPSTFEFMALAPSPSTYGLSNATTSGFGNFMGTYDFSGVTASDGRIALRYTSNYSGISYNLDDFMVQIIPNCPSPVKNSVVATSVGAYNATLSWTDNDPSHNSWTVYYKSSSDTIWSTTVSSSTTTQITGLTPETTYDAYVVTNCAIGDPVHDATFTISFTTTISCLAPTALTATGASPSSMLLSWTENGTASAWEIEYSTSDFTPGTGVGTTVQATSNPFTVTGLSGNTLYKFYVRSVCAVSDTSLWSNVASDVTLCNLVVVTDSTPFIENFENVIGGLPTCWTNTCDVGNTIWTVVNSDFHGTITHACSGSNAVQFYPTGYGTYGSESSLQLPTMDISGLTNPVLTYWYSNQAYNPTSWHYQDVLEVYYRPSPNDPWTRCAIHNDNISWTSNSLTLYYPSSTYQIKFKATTHAGYGINMDDIVVMENNGLPPPIVPPTVITQSITNITATSATLHGSFSLGSEPILDHGFEWKETSGGTYTPVSVAGSPMDYDLTGLMASTNHTFRAFATTPSGTTYGSELSFITLNQEGTCPTPTNVIADSITQTSANISWTQEYGTASSWNILYKENSASNWNTLTISDNPYTLADLTPGTVYLAQVKARCLNGLISNPTPIFSFTTLPDGINDYTIDNTVTVFPNPTTGTIQIQCSEGMLETVSLYDVYGKLLQTMNADSPNVSLNLSSYTAGTYFVRVTTGKGVVTKRVIKN